jgi:hypothetical protein
VPSEPATPSAPPAPRPAARQSLFAPVLGALLAASGVFGLLAVADVYDVDLAVAFAAGVAVVGVTIAAGAMMQRRVGGLVPIGLVLFAAFGVAAAMPVSISSGVGEKSEQPASVAALESSYELGMGELELDLSAVTLRAGTTPVEASVGIGSLVITVPKDVALEIDAHAGVGEINVLGEREDGIDADRTLRFAGSTPAAPVLKVEADVGIGNVEVQRG